MAGALAISVIATPVAAADYWLSGVGKDVVDFVDIASIRDVGCKASTNGAFTACNGRLVATPPKEELFNAWITRVFRTDGKEKRPIKHEKFLAKFDCLNRKMYISTIYSYDENGDVVKSVVDGQSLVVDVVPDSIADVDLGLVCDPLLRDKGDRLGDVDLVAVADSYLARSK